MKSQQSSANLLELILPSNNNEGAKDGEVTLVDESNATITLHKIVAFLRATGESTQNIASKLDLSESEVELLLNQSHMQNLVLSAQVSLGMPLEARLQSAAETAFEKRYKLMFSGDEKIVDRVTESFLDRYLGKATQVVESRNFNFNTSVDIASIDKDIEASERRLKLLEEQQKKLDATYNK